MGCLCARARENPDSKQDSEQRETETRSVNVSHVRAALHSEAVEGRSRKKKPAFKMQLTLPVESENCSTPGKHRSKPRTPQSNIHKLEVPSDQGSSDSSSRYGGETPRAGGVNVARRGSTNSRLGGGSPRSAEASPRPARASNRSEDSVGRRGSAGSIYEGSNFRLGSAAGEKREPANSTGLGLGVRLRDIRVVFGGLERYYRLTEEKVGNLVKAEQSNTGRKYWIQMHERTQEQSNKKTRQMLMKLKSLDHPNILKVVDSLQDSSRLCVVYEATMGGTVAELCARSKGINEQWASAIMRQVFAALRHCLSKGFVLNSLHVLFVEPPTEDCRLTVKLLVSLEDMQESDSEDMQPGNSDLGKCLQNCGMSISALLTGELNLQKLQTAHSSQKWKSTYAKWQAVSVQAKSLTKSLLSRDYRKRPTLEQCLHHPWIAATLPQLTLTPALRTTLRNMAKRRPATSLKKALLQLILLFVLSSEDLREVKEAFAELDTDMDGAVSEEELRVQLNRLFPEEQAQAALTAITSTAELSEGKLAYSEFLLWGCSRKVFTSIDLLDTAFKLLDRDRDGAVGRQDLKEFLCLESDGCSDSMAWEVLISSISNDSSGAFHFEDLSTFIQKR